MKALLIATSLMFGTAAMAQDMGAPTPPTGPNAASPAPDTAMPATTDAPMTAPADPGIAPTGSPMPAAQAPMASGGSPTASDPSAYPPCSRTVTDKCTAGGKKMAMSRGKGMKKKM